MYVPWPFRYTQQMCAEIPMDLVDTVFDKSISVRQTKVNVRSRSLAQNMVLISFLLIGCSDREIESPPALSPPPDPVVDPGRDPANAEDLLGLYPSRKPLVLKRTACSAFEAYRDGSRIVCANGSSVDLWDMTSGKKVLSLNHRDMVIAVALARDEKTLLTATMGATSPVRLWDLRDGRQIHEYASPFAPQEVLSEVNGDRVLSHFPWDHPAAWCTPCGSFGSVYGFGYTSVEFSPSGRTIAIGCNDGSVILLDRDTGRRTGHLVADSQRIHTIVFSPDETRILTADRHRNVQLWDRESETLIQEYGPKKQEGADQARVPMAFCPDGAEFAFQRGAVRIANAVTGEEIPQLPTDGDRSYSPLSFDGGVAFLPAGRLLENVGNLINIRDTVTGKLSHSHHCRSGINRCYEPRVEYVRYLPDIPAAMAVEITNDENTMHDDWVSISVVPFSEFWDVSTPLESAEDGFSVKFPEEPRRIERTNTMNSLPVTEVIYSCRSTGAKFEVLVTTYPTPFIPARIREDLDAARDRVSQMEGFKLTKDKQVQIGNHVAREVWLKQIGVPDGTVKHVLFAYRGNRKYRASVITWRGKFPAAAAAAFVGSFVFVE